MHRIRKLRESKGRSQADVASLGSIGHLKPLIDRLASVKPAMLARVTTILEEVVLLAGDTSTAKLATRKVASQVRNGKAK